MGEQLSASKIEKAWNRAAPYIYVFYPLLYGGDDNERALPQGKKIGDEDWISQVAQLAERSTLEKHLGDAAFAADVLAGTSTRHVRNRDFKGVLRKQPLLREFNADEQTIIKSFDDKAPIKD